MKTCKTCGSHAFNLRRESIDQDGLCDVCFWQNKAERPVDCRTCNRAYIRMTNEIGCRSVGNCTNADRYEPLPPMRLWRTTP